jgi:hypothetical protein
VEARREALLDIIAVGRPMTVRQVFYQATVRGLVEKAESGYGKVQADLTVMRRAGELPYDWLADNTRWQRKPRTFDSIEQALKDTATLYRKSLWTDADAYVEIWLEKDALSGAIYPVTSMSDVPLMVARGYASLSFLTARLSTSIRWPFRSTSIISATSIRRHQERRRGQTRNTTGKLACGYAVSSCKSWCVASPAITATRTQQNCCLPSIATVTVRGA